MSHPLCVGYNYKDRCGKSNTACECVILFTSCRLEVTLEVTRLRLRSDLEVISEEEEVEEEK